MKILSKSSIAFLILILMYSTCNANVNFIAGGSDGGNSGNTMVYSQDGITWIRIVSPFSAKCSGLAYSEIQNKWVGLGTGLNTIAYSLDGITWVGLGNSVFSTQGNRVAYSSSQNLWMATGAGANNLAYSRNGIDWTYSNTPFNTQASDVVYANNLQRWVAVGTTTNTIAYSSDGINWIGLGESIFVAVGQGYSINYDAGVGQFIVGGQGVGFPFGYSLDGIHWVGHAGIFSTAIQGAAYGQGKWIITGNPTFIGNPFANTSDVVSGIWSSYPIQTTISEGEYIVYHSSLDKWVMTGSGANMIVYSNDGVTWNAAGNPFISNGFVIAMSNTLFVSPSNSISGPVTGNIICNSTIINTNSSVILDGNLIIQGDLYIFGVLKMSNTSTLNVTGLLSISGSLIYPLNSMQIQAQTIYAHGNLTLILDSKPAQTTTITIAQYQSIEGQFNNIGLVILNPEDDNSNQCLTSTTNYGESVLSVVLNINPCLGEYPVSINGSQKNKNEQFPVWAIALIACIVSVAGIIGGAMIIFLTRRAIVLRNINRNAKLRKEAIENMQASNTLNYNPTL